MSSEETHEIRQENEIEALKAIFGDDLRDLRTKSPWKVWKPMDISITLTPQQGNSGFQEVHAKVDLHITCTTSYPDEAPKILLENGRGISANLLQQLQVDLAGKTKELLGEVMVFELAQYVQVFLHQHNKPGIKSFYEEMLARQRTLREQLQQAEQLEKDRERQVMISEIQRKQEILKLEHKLRKEQQRLNSENSNESESGNTRKGSVPRSNSTESGEDYVCDHQSTIFLDFSNVEREIQRTRCISHSNRGCVIYAGIDTETGELFVVNEWTVVSKSPSDFTYIQRQVASIEQELNYLVKLRHQYLSPYISIKQDYFPNDSKIVIHILREFILGVSCSSLFLTEHIQVDTDMLRHIASGVLNAVDFLHRNNVVHKEIKGSCVYLTNKGFVKVAGYSLDKRLCDLASQSHTSNTYSKKTDIFKFGIFILSLIKATNIDENNIEIPHSVSPDLHDFLTKCLAKEEKERFTALQLLNHSFVRMRFDRFSPQHKIKDIPGDSSPELVPIDLTFPQSNSGQSRVQNEFEVLQWLGKGAFGDVLKVRNKLDGGYYAIKRIELNPKNKQLNKKITREVKLLSKLNHENVVRYYNAWIESAVLEENRPDSSQISSEIVPKIIKKELIFKDDIELLAPPVKDVEWSISCDTKSKAGRKNSTSSSSSSDEDSDEEDWDLMLNVDSSDSESIEFEKDSADSVSTNSNITEEKTANPPAQRLVKEIQFLYIQMEFCEKSTLRTAIDGGLHTDMERALRLFREIVEGLAHIHQQGMIHRDLKPVNIFLDSNDHVKIGDFGLATTNILVKQTDAANIMKSMQDSEKEVWSQDGIADGSLTSQVGTVLYAAPELSSKIKIIYNQKVDIYSLGIIFFEMCYTPLNTGMERIKILSALRNKDVTFPHDFTVKGYHKQETLIRWVLNHDVSQRPTSKELLQSEYLPPPIKEEGDLQEIIRRVLSNTQRKAYKFLIESCFKQIAPPEQEFTYGMVSSTSSPAKSLQTFEFVKDTIIRIFKVHGGQNLSTPMLMPKNKYYESTESCVLLMTHSGGVVSIPHDLRVPFARYIAWHGITLLRRYSIERVFREHKSYGFHPKELYECAFDIVTPNSGNYMYDAELLYIVNEIVNALVGLKNKNFLIRLNHVSLLKSILLHCGIKEKHDEVYKILSDAKDGRVTKFQIKTHLISLGLSDNNISTLFNLIELEYPLSKLVATLQMITKKKSSEASQLAKQALQELKLVIQNVEILGVSFNIVIAPGLVCNIQQYSGMMWQFVCELKKKRKKGGLDVLAAGGRYDLMVANYPNIKENIGLSRRKQSAVGISICMDKLIQALEEEGPVEVSSLDTVVCSLGSKSLLKEKSKILIDLWTVGIRCSLIEAGSVEEIQEQCTELNVSHAIILKDTEHGMVRIRSWDRDRFHERKVNVLEMVETVQRILKQGNESGQENLSSKGFNVEHNHDATVSVLFVTSEKLSATARKRSENQIKSQLDGIFKRITGDVVILGLSIDANTIRTLSSYLDFESEHQYHKSVQSVIEKHQRHKKYLLEICDEIFEQKSKKASPIIILYSLPDAFHKILL